MVQLVRRCVGDGGFVINPNRRLLRDCDSCVTPGVACSAASNTQIARPADRRHVGSSFWSRDDANTAFAGRFGVGPD
jgi:hypothetical protein